VQPVSGDRPGGTSGRLLSAALRLLRSDLIWVVAISAAAWWQLRTTLGTSPRIWVDTLYENQFVDDCLRNDSCTILGPGATVGIFHSAGYLHWRALLSWLGLGADGTFGALLILNGIGVGLTALAARRLGGRLAAAAAALVMITSIGDPLQMHVISDVAPVPFLGAVFLLVAMATAFRDSLVFTAILGMVIGVMVDVYASTILFAVSAAAIAVLQPRRRWSHLLIGALAFAVVAFAVAPASWITDVQVLLIGKHMGNNHPNARPLSDIRAAWLAGWAGVWWLLSMTVGPLRRRLAIPGAILLPLFASLAYGVVSGSLEPQDKYFAHVMAAVSVCLVVPPVVLGRLIWDSTKSHATWLAPLAIPVTWLFWLTPYAAAAAIYEGRAHVMFVRSPTFTYDDLAKTERVLADRGWDAVGAALNLKTLDEMVKRSALRWVPDWPTSGKSNRFERAFLLKIASEGIHEAFPPPGVTLIASTPDDRTVLAFACSWIDWSSFKACVSRPGSTDETCSPSGIPDDQQIHDQLPGMPMPDGTNPKPQTLSLHFPLKPQEACPDFAVSMPRVPLACPGRIVSIGGDASAISQNGRYARVSRSQWPGGTPPGDLVVEWELGRHECGIAYRGYPPFFVEGDVQSVAVMEKLIKIMWPWEPKDD
jgi:hypothetical protein